MTGDQLRTLLDRAFEVLAESEGILPALESAHAVAFALKLARELPRRAWVLVNLVWIVAVRLRRRRPERRRR